MAGCKDQPHLFKSILEDCENRNGHLAQAWIDYQKAFDSVPHDWIIKSMQICGIAKEIVQFCALTMPHWKTKLSLRTDSKEILSRTIRIKRRIFQGDSLSPLLFCIAMVPLSMLIKELGKGYKLQDSRTLITHLFYMDDLKLICKARTELRNQLQIVKQFSDDIRMKFGVDKCAILTIRNGKRTETPSIKVDSTEIRTLEAESIYKYLGVDEAEVMDHKGMKEKLIKEYRKRIRAVLSTQLNARNKLSAVGSLAVPVLQYSFGIIKWTIGEIRQLDRDTRKLLTMYKCHHPEASVDRLYVARRNGGRGLLKLEKMYKSAVINLAMYIEENANVDYLVAQVKHHDSKQSAITSIQKKSRRYLGELNISESLIDIRERRKRKKIVKDALDRADQEAWRSKEMYGQYIREFSVQPLDKENSLRWLSTAGLKPETESLIVAAQDQALNTKYRQGRIMNLGVDTKCRLCGNAEETIEHVTSGCPMLAKVEYLRRHDKVATILHFEICKYYGIPDMARMWYEHTPKQVQITPDGRTTVLWNQSIQTDREIKANKPDIVIKEQTKCTLIDVAIPSERNVLGKEAEKLLKYKDLAIELQRMWNKKVEIVPIVVSATGNVSRNFHKYVSKIPGKQRPEELQKQAILGTSHILRKVL